MELHSELWNEMYIDIRLKQKHSDQILMAFFFGYLSVCMIYEALYKPWS